MRRYGGQFITNNPNNVGGGDVSAHNNKLCKISVTTYAPFESCRQGRAVRVMMVKMRAQLEVRGGLGCTLLWAAVLGRRVGEHGMMEWWERWVLSFIHPPRGALKVHTGFIFHQPAHPPTQGDPKIRIQKIFFFGGKISKFFSRTTQAHTYLTA